MQLIKIENNSIVMISWFSSSLKIIISSHFSNFEISKLNFFGKEIRKYINSCIFDKNNNWTPPKDVLKGILRYFEIYNENDLKNAIKNYEILVLDRNNMAHNIHFREKNRTFLILFEIISLLQIKSI